MLGRSETSLTTARVHMPHRPLTVPNFAPPGAGAKSRTLPISKQLAERRT